MIDPHVHLRDWEQKNKENLEHGLDVAYRAGLDAVFEMPNTSPAITSREMIEKRIKLADDVIKKSKIKIFHGLYAGITNDAKQIKNVVKAYNDFFPRVVGLKMFAGQSVGNMGIIKGDDQRLVYKTLSSLDYKGVLAVHCEKEDFIDESVWNCNKPFTHTIARPAKAEIESVKDQIRFANESGFKGILHICHISVPKALEEIEKARAKVKFKITCGVTPHHCMLYDEMMNDENGIFLKVNPPLRQKEMQKNILKALFDGRIDWIETDHAPHTLKDKTEKYASGIPGLAYYPHFIKFLLEKGMSEKKLADLTHSNIVKSFKIKIKNTKRNPDYDLADEYEYDAFENVKGK